MKRWRIVILLISMILLGAIRAKELTILRPFYQYTPAPKLKTFDHAKFRTPKEQLQLLTLWESILTGRRARLDKSVKERYQILGLNHLFTPSGFHLSAVITPVFKCIRNKNYQISLLIMIGILLQGFKGFYALKRMLLIKINQHAFGKMSGFVTAIILDILWGTFQNQTLSFTFSFMFLGLIYSGLNRLALIVWFFIAQIIIAFFFGKLISPLLLIIAPIINILFALAMPFLLLLSFPLWDWQLKLGIFVLKFAHDLVVFGSGICFRFPLVEVHIFTIFLLFLLLFEKKKLIPIGILLFSTSLNRDLGRTPNFTKNDYVPRGIQLRTIYDERMVKVFFDDGNCKMRLVRGFWWKNCSPLRRSSSKKNTN